MKTFKVKVFKVKSVLEPVVKITGLSVLQSAEVDDIISNLKNEFCIHHGIQTNDEYIGYKQSITLVRCEDERCKPIYNSGR